MKDTSMWNEDQSLLIRKFEFDNFKQALDFVNKVGQLAEKVNHHPDIKLGYGYAEISLTTHSTSAVTQKDRSLSKQIDQLIEVKK